MKYLINTKSGKVLAKGKKQIIDTIASWEEFDVCRNGRIIVTKGNGSRETFTTKNINGALDFYEEWCSPRGVRGVYEVVSSKKFI